MVTLMILVKMLFVFLFTFSSVILIEYFDYHVRFVVIVLLDWCLWCNQLNPFVVLLVSGTTGVGGHGGNAVRGT